MNSRFDYRDPGQDRAYCDGLEAKDDIDSETPVFCHYCRRRLVDVEFAPFCGPECRIDAEHEEG